MGILQNRQTNFIHFLIKLINILKNSKIAMNESYNDFNIDSKKLILNIKYHKEVVFCLCVLDDGRLASCSRDCNIIIYNKISFKPDLKIKAHKDIVKCIIKLDSNFLASCSNDKTIKIIKIENNTFTILQSLNEHKNNINRIIELKNKQKNLVSCSDDKSVIIYSKKNNEYIKDYQLKTKAICHSVTQIKENEICYLEIYYNYYYDYQECNIYFFDLKNRNKKQTINKYNSSSAIFRTFNMITKNLLIIGGKDEITIIDVNLYAVIKEINLYNCDWIFGFCMLNENMFITGGDYGIIRQWKIEGDNIKIISKKQNAHESSKTVYALVKIGNGKIASCSSDNSIKIW